MKYAWSNTGSRYRALAVCFGLAVACSLQFMASSKVRADEPEVDPNQPKVIRLTLHPAPLVTPALKHRLVPGYFERKPGNAVPFYYRALLVYQQNQGQKELERHHAEAFSRWENQPCEGEVREEIKKWLAAFPAGALGELREAVYREECDFDYRLADRGGVELISFLLPEVQEMRTLGRYLRLKARVEISEGKYDDALESLRMGYQIGHDTASEPLLINGLVGVAVASLMNTELENWVGSAESPNLYWAIAALPQPLVDLRPALEQESRLPEVMFSFLKDADKTQRPPEEWQRILNEAVGQITAIAGDIQGDPSSDTLPNRLAVTALLMRAYPIAKSELQKSGYNAETLEKMAVAQVVAIHMQQVCRYVGDEIAKGAYLPPHQREAYYATVDKRLIQEGFLGPGSKPREPIPLASILMPAVSRALSAQTRLERDFAALQTLEAIRAHLAATGSLPEKLDDIKLVPVPINPAFGTPFKYTLSGEKAVLEVPPTSAGQQAVYGKRYELTAAKK